MARRKKKDFDYDDYMDDESSAIESAQPEVAKVSLDDFIVTEKVAAFVDSYKPCDEFTDGAIGFDDAKLRELFKGYVCGLGDPMKLYMEHLKLAGFRMTVSVATGELTMFAVRKYEY